MQYKGFDIFLFDNDPLSSDFEPQGGQDRCVEVYGIIFKNNGFGELVYRQLTTDGSYGLIYEERLKLSKSELEEIAEPFEKNNSKKSDNYFDQLPVKKLFKNNEK